jgi:hypothetical protein
MSSGRRATGEAEKAPGLARRVLEPPRPIINANWVRELETENGGLGRGLGLDLRDHDPVSDSTIPKNV